MSRIGRDAPAMDDLDDADLRPTWTGSGRAQHDDGDLAETTARDRRSATCLRTAAGRARAVTTAPAGAGQWHRRWPAPRAVAASGGLSEQWHDIQAIFVDDPHGSVELAAAAAEAAVSALVESLPQRQAALVPAGGFRLTRAAPSSCARRCAVTGSSASAWPSSTGSSAQTRRWLS